MSRMIFVNLPVQDLARSVDFFKNLGFEFNAQFTDDKATCMVINDQAYAMLLVEDFFAGFTTRPVADATAATEAICALSADSRADVDDLVGKALAAGGQEVKEPQDHGFMYGRSFTDPDGHIWEVLWMDPATIAS